MADSPAHGPAASRILRREDRTALTGDHCPTSGTWSVPSRPGTELALLRGELMPTVDGHDVLWQYRTSLPTLIQDNP